MLPLDASICMEDGFADAIDPSHPNHTYLYSESIAEAKREITSFCDSLQASRDIRVSYDYGEERIRVFNKF